MDATRPDRPAPASGPAPAGAPPFVSVVLPVRNEEAHVRACLERLLAQDHPADRLEILVVDGRSDDRTREVVHEVAATAAPGRVRLVDNPERIVPPALNAGIRAARGSVIVRMDGHTVPEPDYVRRCVEALERSGAWNVGGPMLPRGATPFGRAVAIAQSHPLGVGDAKFHFDGEAAWVDTVYMGAFRRDAFARAGGFDESMVRNQDYEMNVRIREAGGGVLLDPSIRSVYTPRGTVRGLAKQYFGYGWWRVQTLRRHRASARWRQLLPPAFVAFVALAALLAPWSDLARLGLAASLGPWLAALAASGARVAWKGGDAREGIATGARFALAVAVMHLAYGAGFALNVATGARYPYRDPGPRVPAMPLAGDPSADPDAGPGSGAGERPATGRPPAAGVA